MYKNSLSTRREICVLLRVCCQEYTPRRARASAVHIPTFLRVQVANWLPRAGKAKVTYAGGSTFEGVFNGERIKEGQGKYTWMKPAEEDGEDPQASFVLFLYHLCAVWRTLDASRSASVATVTDVR